MTAQPEEDSLWVLSWYPKITPYRLAFIITTGGLGIAKALLVSKDKPASSTTVEWIAGVVVALIFQFLGSYEYNTTRSPYVDWIFRYDCLGPRISSRLDYSDTLPLATGYRLLVSALLATFGLGKMFCGYLGLSTEMNTLDWITAVPLTLGLYCIGLYEDNGSTVQRKFFDVDYAPQVTLLFNAVFVLTVYLGGITPCVFWIQYWAEALHAALVEKDATPSQGAWNSTFGHALKWGGVAGYLLMLEVGVLALGVILWPIIKGCSGRRAPLLRYHALITFFLTCYAFAFVICICGLIIQLSIAMPVYAVCFSISHTGSSLPLPMRVIMPFIVTICTAVAVAPALILPIIFWQLLNGFKWLFLVDK